MLMPDKHSASNRDRSIRGYVDAFNFLGSSRILSHTFVLEFFLTVVVDGTVRKSIRTLFNNYAITSAIFRTRGIRRFARKAASTVIVKFMICDIYTGFFLSK